MNAQDWLPTSGVSGLRGGSHLPQKSTRPARIVVFGSFLGGYHVLSELIFGELADRVTVVGVATDDPTQSYTNAKVRLWRHPHKRAGKSHALPQQNQSDRASRPIFGKRYSP